MSLSAPTPAEVKAFRQAIGGVSQAQLADLVGSSKRAVESWESGDRDPPAMLRLAFAAIDASLRPWTYEGPTLADLEDEFAQTLAALGSLDGTIDADPARLAKLRAELDELRLQIRALK